MRGTRRSVQQPRHRLVADKDTHDVTSFPINVSGLHARAIVVNRLAFKSGHDFRNLQMNRQLDGDFHTIKAVFFYPLSFSAIALYCYGRIEGPMCKAH